MLTLLRRQWPLGLLACLQVIGAHAAGHEPMIQPKLQFRSALDSYRPFAEQAVDSWVDTNDVVRRIGGWRTYAAERESIAAPPQGGGQRSSQPPSQPEGNAHPQGGHGAKR